MRKIWGFILFIVACFIFVGDIHAETDLNIKVDSSSFVVSKRDVTVGDSVKIQVKITSNLERPIEIVSVEFTKPATFNATRFFNFKYNESTGFYETVINIDNTWQNGTYLIDELFFRDGEIVDIIYNNKNPHSLGYNWSEDSGAIDLSNCSFTVSGTTADHENPKLYRDTLKVENIYTVTGESVKFSVAASDNREVQNASVTVISKNSKEDGNVGVEWVRLDYNETTGLYEGYLTIEDEHPDGFWFVSTVAVYDTSDNHDQEHSWDESKYYFYNFKNNPKSKLDLDTIEVDRTKATAGESVNLSFVVMNDLEVRKVLVYYRKGNTLKSDVIEAKYDKILYSNPVYYDSIKIYEQYFVRYVAKIDFDDYGYNGNWVIEKIEIFNTRDDVTTFYNKNLSNNDNSVNLDAGNFETYGLIYDEVVPNVETISLDKNYVYYKDKVIIGVDVVDNESGVQRVVANYTMPDGSSEDFILNKNGNRYEYVFNYDSISKVGEYKFNLLTAFDYAGNFRQTEALDNGDSLNFKFLDVINIVAPDKYLSTTTSYSLKAIILPSGQYTSGVTWSSSNRNIATINATTGVLSTKSSTGRVTITARLNDGSGISGSIELIVANVAARVGEKFSISNTNFIGYSDVIWEIDDESILGKTNKQGFTAINSLYQHYIEVKGLKEGVTTIRMLTPSGDRILSSPVYVYDSLISMSSQYSSLEMNKSDKLNLNVKTRFTGDKKAELLYVSENENVVIVDQNGNVSAVGGGRTNIVVYSKYSNISLTIPVVVVVYTTDLVLEEENVYLNEENNVYQIKYKVLPDDALDKSVTFISSDENIASVNNEGLVTANKNGEVIITVKTNDGKHSKNIKVVVTDLKTNINTLFYDEIDEYIYSGKEIMPNVNIKDGEYSLVKNKDYTIRYEDNINAGKAKMYITGINNYKGEKVIEFIINKAIPNIIYSGKDLNVSYDGIEHGIDLKVESPNDVIVKYADSNGDYVLDKMPKYTELGEYVIKYELSINDNYETIKGSNKLSIDLVLSEDKKTFDMVLPVGTRSIDFSEQNIVSIDSKGLVTALNNGNTVVIFKDVNNNILKKINVKVVGLRIDINSLYLGIIESGIYTGKEIKPEITVMDGEYTLVKDKDYTIRYENNINVGLAKMYITGINSYKGEAILGFSIYKSYPPIVYKGMDNVVIYNGKSHTIDLNIESPDNVIVKYADSNGDYILDEKPKYINAGEYEIKYELSINDNYEKIYDMNRLVISKASIVDNTLDTVVTYDGLEHSLDLDFGVEDYEISFMYNTINYEAYFTNNYSTPLDTIYCDELPKFINPGYYQVTYFINKDNYYEHIGTREVRIGGITGYDKKNIKIKNNMLILNSSLRNGNNLFDKFNLIINYGATYHHYDNDMKPSANIFLKTGDYLHYEVDNKIAHNFMVVIKGDLSGDGDIDSLDLASMMNHISGKKELSGVYMEASYLNADEDIDSLDLAYLMNQIAGKEGY